MSQPPTKQKHYLNTLVIDVKPYRLLHGPCGFPHQTPIGVGRFFSSLTVTSEIVWVRPFTVLPAGDKERNTSQRGVRRRNARAETTGEY